jgi:hypothetical protein
MRRVVILGRGAAGKSTLARQLGELTGLPVAELDTMFWQPGLTPAEPARWAACQRELCGRASWIIDGDLGHYDQDLRMRLRAADTIIVLDLSLPRVTWRTLRRGRERADYWRWVWAYRRRYLPRIRAAIAANAPHADLFVLRSPAKTRHFISALRPHAAPVPEPHPPLVVNTMWPLDEFTADNGATRFIPGSHRWEPGRQPGPDDPVRTAEMSPRIGAVLPGQPLARRRREPD